MERKKKIFLLNSVLNEKLFQIPTDIFNLELICKIICRLSFFFGILLYSAHSRVNRGNLVLVFRSHQDSFRRNLEELRVEWQHSTPRFTQLPERGNDNVKCYFHNFEKVPALRRYLRGRNRRQGRPLRDSSHACGREQSVELF